MSADIYSALMEAFITPDRDISCYPVRVSAAGAIAQLVEVRKSALPMFLYINVD